MDCWIWKPVSHSFFQDCGGIWMLPLFHAYVHDCDVCVVSGCESGTTTTTPVVFPRLVYLLSCGHGDGVLCCSPLWTVSQAFYRCYIYILYLHVRIHWMPSIKIIMLHKKYQIYLTFPHSRTSSAYKRSSRSSNRWGACRSRTLPVDKKELHSHYSKQVWHFTDTSHWYVYLYS